MGKNDLKPTDLTLEELLAAYNNPESGYKSDFLISEIAIFLDEGEEEAKKAEAFLRDLLDSENPDDKHLAFLLLQIWKQRGKKLLENLRRPRKIQTTRNFLREFLVK